VVERGCVHIAREQGGGVAARDRVSIVIRHH
jgi:hypothetical protein